MNSRWTMGLWIAIVWVLSSGCALKVATVEGSANSISAQLSRETKGDFALKDELGRIVDVESAYRDRLRFSIPEPDGGRRCFQIADPKGNLLETSRGVSLFYQPIHAATGDRNVVAASIERRNALLGWASNELDTIQRRRRNNPAFETGTCQLKPRTTPPPEAPIGDCSAGVTYGFGYALCLTAAGVDFACDVAFDQRGDDLGSEFASFVASNSCSSLVDLAMGTDYEGIVANIYISLVDKFGDYLLRYGDGMGGWAGLLIKGWATVAKIQRFGQCVDQAYSSLEGQCDEWEREVDRPKTQLDECYKDTAVIESTPPSVVRQWKSERQTLASTLFETETAIRNAEAQVAQSGLPPCIGEARDTESPPGSVEGWTLKDSSEFPARQSGLRKGDLILAINGAVIDSANAGQTVIAGLESQSVSVHYSRAGSVGILFTKVER